MKDNGSHSLIICVDYSYLYQQENFLTLKLVPFLYLFMKVENVIQNVLMNYDMKIICTQILLTNLSWLVKTNNIIWAVSLTD